MSKPLVLFAGGGSGGHIAPLLAVMRELKKQFSDVACAYVGLPSDLQSPLLDESGLVFERYSIQAGKLHRFVTLDQFRQAARMLQGSLQAGALLDRIRPSIIFCKGSMVSVPIARAASKRGIPVYLHETDAAPGLANRIISRYATAIFTAFPTQAYTSLPAEKLVETGQPVREAFYASDKKSTLKIGDRELSPDLPVVVVIGGSQGARRINEIVSSQWGKFLENVQLVHISGNLDFSSLEKSAASLPDSQRANLFLVDFLAKGVPDLFGRASVVISRAGGTIFELAAAGSPTVLVPLSTAAQDHQRINASVLEAAKAAVVIDETEMDAGQKLYEVVTSLISNPEQAAAISRAIGAFSHPDAASRMVEIIGRGLEPGGKIR